MLSGCRSGMIRTVYIVAVWLIGARAFFVAAQKTFFRDQKNFFLKVCGELMQGRKRANYAGKWSRHDVKRSDTTGQCLYDVERPYTM